MRPTAAPLALLLCWLGGPAAAATAGPPTCLAERARFAVGEAYSEELAERARVAAGARIVRKIEPGGAYTMELRADRINIEVDAAGIVERARCG